MIFKKIYFAIAFLLFISSNIFSQQFFKNAETNGVHTKENTSFISRVTETNTLGQVFVSIDDLKNNVNDQGQLSFTNPLTGEHLKASGFRVTYQDNKNYSWTGKLDEKGSILTIIRNPGGVIGMLKQPQNFYFIHPLTPEVSLFVEVDNEKYDDIQCATENGLLHSSSFSLDNAICEMATGCNEIIDVLVVFTPDALDFLRALDNPFYATLYAIFGVETMNIALDNSGIESEMRYAWTSYDFPHHHVHNISVDKAILSDDQIMKNIRNIYGADLVVLMTDRDYGPTYGVAETTVPHIDSVSAIVEISSIFGPRWTFAHELAHLFGALHNRTSNVDQPMVEGDDTNICAHGWRFIDNDDEERFSIMARLVGDQENGRELLFSNPEREFNGSPTGEPNNNNAGRIINTTCGIADYRDSPYFSAKIIGFDRLCMCVQAPEEPLYLDNRGYSAEVDQASSPFLGHPPYTYNWYWNQSGIFTNNNPGSFISDESSVSINFTPCDHFFLRLVVTSSDGAVYESVRRISTEQCHDCALYSCFVDGNYDNKLKSDQVNFRNSSVISDKIEIHPNPTKGEIDISFSIDEVTNVSTLIVDINGRVVYNEDEITLEKGLYKRHMSIENFSPGVYFYFQKRGEQYYNQKIIKQ